MRKSKISIVVPTYKENDNLTPLTERISETLENEKYDFEIIIVDDNSSDGSEETVAKLSKKFPVAIKVRKAERGLSSAVIEGIRISKGDYILVMDADLSHPPESIPSLIMPLIDNTAQFVVGSRFVKGGSAEHFNFYRRLNAFISKMMARPFANIKDPMAGFFAFNRSIMKDLAILNPLGFKIGLELIVKFSPSKIIEVPISFKERLYGESKLSFKEQLLYIRHLIRLFHYKYKSLSQFIRFSVIGTSGVFVNLLTTFFCVELIGIIYKVAIVIAFIISLTTNFILNKMFSFPESSESNYFKMYFLYIIVCLAGLSVNWTISVYLYNTYPFFNRFYLLSSSLGIIGGMVINFAGSKFFVYKS